VIAFLEAAGAAVKLGGGQGFFEQGGEVGDEEGGLGKRFLRESNEGFEAFADDVNVGQAGFVGEDFPGGIEEGGWGIRIRIKIRRNPHLTLTLSPPIGWERRGNSGVRRHVVRKFVQRRLVGGRGIRIRIRIKIRIKIKIKIKIRIGGRELGEPGLDVLLEGFLGGQILGDDDDGTVGKQPGEENGQEGVGGGADGVEGQRLPLLHALAQGLHGGS
jgi:hypothetical protein